ncbi:fungal-specific transcription factor domain-containing protein [Leptodontidium sp. MPI-SDFR-AT-0119]|nr:fungal-specific transcription factor domain-containing protein [Leptodontidium sp. MPI-SDFR-AT-0119]
MTNPIGMRHPEAQVSLGRKYKSRKERPCDACRKRKICCTRDAYEKDCSLCRTRGESCQYVLPPNVRRNRQPNAAPQTSTSSPSSTGSIPSRRRETRPRPLGSNGNREWICQFVGLSGDQDPYVLRHCSFNQQNCYRGAEWAVLKIKGDTNGDVPLHFTVVPDTQLDARPDHYPTTDTEAVVEPHANDLLHTYFEVVHPSYPLLDPSRFNSPPVTGDPLLAVMYNLAAPFCSSSPLHFPALSSFVQQALPIEHQHPRLETLEASLLHLQRHTPTSPSPTLPGLSSSIGSLAGIAHDLGLNNDPSSWSLSPTDTNRRIRIWWALHIQDKWSALGLGRPSYLNDEHSNVPLPTISNFSHLGLANTPLTLTPALQFIAMAHLSSILSDVLNTFYTLKAVERIKLLPIEMLFSILDGFQERLRIFRDDHLCPLCSGSGNGGLDSTGSVVLAFYTIEIVLLRAVLRCLPMNHPGYAGLRGQAKTTLLNVVEFLEKMSVSRLKAFWWSPMTRLNFSLAGSFMFSQFLTSHTTHDIELWSTTIAHYRSLLRLHSTSFEMTRLASMRMDLLAQGMGVDSPLPLNLEREDSIRESGGILGRGFGVVGVGLGMSDVVGFGDGLKREVLDPRSAEEWIMRQGDGGLLLC